MIKYGDIADDCGLIGYKKGSYTTWVVGNYELAHGKETVFN